MAVVVAAAFALALVPQIRIAAPVCRRSSPLVLGGFQQKEAPALVAGSRVSLVFSGGSASKLQEAACDGGNCDPGLTGVIYSLPSGRIEIIAEGPQDTITAFVKRVRDAAVGVQAGRCVRVQGVDRPPGQRHPAVEVGQCLLAEMRVADMAESWSATSLKAAISVGQTKVKSRG